jgi:hypothetical protein
MCPWSSRRQDPGDLLVLGWSARPNELAIAPTVLRHLLYTQLNLQIKLEQLKLSKTYPTIRLKGRALSLCQTRTRSESLLS